jgi:hypothetical protein
MIKNIITVIYPDEFTASFVIKTNGQLVDHNDILEMVFDQWNEGSNRECELFRNSKIRSLGVNDIVCVNGTYYQCASFGWNEVTPEYVNKLEADVANHPRRKDGAWFTLEDVMWERNKRAGFVAGV